MQATVKEAARLAGVPVRTVYAWIRAQRMTATEPAAGGRGVLVDPLEVQELAEHRRPTGRLARVDHAP